MAIKRTVVFLLTAVMLSLAAIPPAGAATMEQKPSSTAVVYDVLFMRPLGVVATALGATLFIVGLPFTIPSRSVGVAAEKLVAAPFNFTFCRPIGNMDYLNDFEDQGNP
jgi:hypothetical protein